MKNRLLARLGATDQEQASYQTPDHTRSVEEEGTVDVSFNTEEVIAACRNSLNFLAGIALPHIFKYNFPPVFITAWAFLVSYAHRERDFSKLAVGLPRGFGKTTWIKLYVLYCILFTKKKFILFISHIDDHAKNAISDIIGMLNEPNIKAVFGDWSVGATINNAQVKKFAFRGRTIILAGLGVNGTLRGLNLGNERPDVMIFEDIQSREQADSKEQSAAMERWMTGTAMLAKSPHGCTYIFIANMYPTPYSILRKLKYQPAWTKFIAGGILADGTSLWEQLHPLKQLLEEYQAFKDSGHPEIFFAEVLNDENANASVLDFTIIPDYDVDEGSIHQGSFIIIDPSNDKTISDDTSIGYYENYDGKAAAIEMHSERLNPQETILKAIEIGLRRNCFFVAVEANAYQHSLLYWFNFICEQRGISGFRAEPIYSGAESKPSRIAGMMKEIWKKNGLIKLHNNVRPLAFNEIQNYSPGKTKQVDNVLDNLTYAPKVIEQYGQDIAMRTVINMLETVVEIPEHNSPF